MAMFKRSQLEDAIAGLTGEPGNPSSELLTRIKRLLDTDRALLVSAKFEKSKLGNHAFFSGPSPGKGTEVAFSEYDVFAVLIGLQMLHHRWPQKFVVQTLRGLRPQLQDLHSTLATQGTKGHHEGDGAVGARLGDLALSGTSSPVLLLIWSDEKTAENGFPSAEIFSDQAEALKRTLEKAGRSATWIELTRPAHLLSEQLSKSAPRKRGRS